VCPALHTTGFMSLLLAARTAVKVRYRGAEGLSSRLHPSCTRNTDGAVDPLHPHPQQTAVRSLPATAACQPYARIWPWSHSATKNIAAATHSGRLKCGDVHGLTSPQLKTRQLRMTRLPASCSQYDTAS
jgi:hypothetical protein